ncbi:MAG TPA: AMP-binding protein [Streptosporangiaceae bacterium]|jgi:O-succinylbenzoic acid--CoA ligase
MLAALAAALDGSGPAILPLDPDLPEAALARTFELFAPSVLHTEKGTSSPTLPAGRSLAAGRTGVRDDTAVVIATSGSTGRPKAVELSAAALIASATASLRRIGAGPGDRWLCCLPTFHIAGIGVLVRSLLAGTDPAFASSASQAALAASDPAHVSLVPTQLRRLLDAGAGPGSVRTVLLGGAASADSLLAEAGAAGWRVVTTYGMSETCGGCVYDGVPLDGVEVTCGPGDGLVEIAGPVLFSGYLDQPELTAEALLTSDLSTGLVGEVRASPRFRTADLGAFDNTGRLVIRGRADDVINTGGEKVAPGDVEAVIGTSPAVADVVVVGLPDPEWGEAVTAFVVATDPGNPPDPDWLRSNVREALSAYAAPKRVLVVPEFPLLPSGKPDRAALRRLEIPQK